VIDKVAQRVGYRRADERDIGLDGILQDLLPAVELAFFLPFGEFRPRPGWGESAPHPARAPASPSPGSAAKEACAGSASSTP